MNKSFFHTLLLIVFLVVIPLQGMAEENYDEYQLKAAITYKVAKFVKWPADAFAHTDQQFVICVLGDKQTVKGFRSLEGQSLGGRTVQIINLPSADKFQHGQLLYIAESHENKVDQILSTLKNSPVLTISDVSSFAARGGMINLIRKGKNVRFAINLVSSHEANLQISSKLNALATEVIREKN